MGMVPRSLWERITINSLLNKIHGVARGSSRVLRGGSWYYRSRLTRSAFRLWYEAHDRDPLNGFRLVRELD
jgi:formylglycine-generating enzyme required for sulfatase activity